MKTVEGRPNEIAARMPEIIPSQVTFDIAPQGEKFGGRTYKVTIRFTGARYDFSAIDTLGNEADAMYAERAIGDYTLIVNELREFRPKTDQGRSCGFCGPTGSDSSLYLPNRDRMEIPDLKVACVGQNFPLREGGVGGLVLPFEHSRFPHRRQKLLQGDLKALVEVANNNPTFSVSFNFGPYSGMSVDHIHAKVEELPELLALERAPKSSRSQRLVDYPAPAIVLNSKKEMTRLWGLVSRLQGAQQSYNLFLRSDRAWIVGRCKLFSEHLPGVRFGSLEVAGLMVFEDRRLVEIGRIISRHHRSLQEELELQRHISRAIVDVCLLETELLLFE